MLRLIWSPENEVPPCEGGIMNAHWSVTGVVAATAVLNWSAKVSVDGEGRLPRLIVCDRGFAFGAYWKPVVAPLIV